MPGKGTSGMDSIRSGAVILGIVAILALGYAGYSQYRRALQSARQAFTLGTLNTIAARLEDKQQALDRPLVHNEIEEIVLATAHGLDEWGHRVVVVVRTTDGRQEFAVVSPGSDGILEHPSITEYFAIPRVDVHGLWEKDIVVVNSNTRTLAGK